MLHWDCFFDVTGDPVSEDEFVGHCLFALDEICAGKSVGLWAESVV